MQINWAEFSLDMSFLGVSSILDGLLGKAETKNWRLTFIAGSFLAIMCAGLKLGSVLKVKL